jgi:hypothetical protein
VMSVNRFYMKVVYAGVAFLLFFTLAIRSFIFSQKKKSDKPVAWKETVGTLDPHGHSHGTIHYQVNGSMYSGTFMLRDADAVNDEKYIMRYNANNPEEIEIDYWHPVFIEGEQTYPFKAIIVKVHKKSILDPTPFVVFAFEVKGIHLKKSVYLPLNYEQLYPNLQAGQHYEVECWAKDANRVVLHLDKPIKDTVNAK